MTTSSSEAASARAPAHPRFYLAAWRWHFYSGLFVVPFLLVLALTGLVMVYFTGFQNRLGNQVYVEPQTSTTTLAAQAQTALAPYHGAALKTYISPKSADMAAWFVLTHQGTTLAVAVNPYTAERLATVDKEHTWFAWAEKIHGTLLLGDTGDLLIEAAAGLGIVMIITGLYLFWPRGTSRWSSVLMPDWRATGRAWWKSLHATVGFWISLVLLAFLLTGMSWTGVWGGKLVQPWASFPAEKWDAVPTSHTTHDSLNTAGSHEVPWGLEQTSMPASVPHAHHTPASNGTSPAPVTLDSAAALAHQLGFAGQYQISLPQDEHGVYTLSRDTMSGDLNNPFRDRTVHIDRYTGKVLAEVGFHDYSGMAKLMAVGIALHQGDVGLWSAWANLLFCLAVILLCISGIVMWWMRRPHNSRLLCAPPAPQTPIWKTGALIMLTTGLAFPVAGTVLLATVVLDYCLLSRLPSLKTR